MDDLAWRVRISVLWLFSEVAYLGMMVLTLLKPGILADILSGEATVQGLGGQVGPEVLLMYAVIVLIPLVMAFLTVTLKRAMTRWANIIIGIVGVVISVVALSAEIAEPYAFAVLLWISKIVVDALIVGYAYKWPREKA